MTDYFLLLGEEARPWLDGDNLKAKYHELTAREHPDVAEASADFADINLAYQTLSDPATRVRHLLELHSDSTMPRTQTVPADIAEFFMPVGEARQGVEMFLKKYAAATSPLGRALLSTEQFAVQERLEGMIEKLTEKQEGLLERVREVDTLWEKDRAAALVELPNMWQSLTYTEKWLATLRESLYRLAAL